MSGEMFARILARGCVLTREEKAPASEGGRYNGSAEAVVWRET